MEKCLSEKPYILVNVHSVFNLPKNEYFYLEIKNGDNNCIWRLILKFLIFFSEPMISREWMRMKKHELTFLLNIALTKDSPSFNVVVVNMMRGEKTPKNSKEILSEENFSLNLAGSSEFSLYKKARNFNYELVLGGFTPNGIYVDKVSLRIVIKNFGMKKRKKYPLYQLFSSRYQFHGLLLLIFSYLPINTLVGIIIRVSRHFDNVLKKKMNFSPLSCHNYVFKMENEKKLVDFYNRFEEYNFRDFSMLIESHVNLNSVYNSNFLVCLKEFEVFFPSNCAVDRIKIGDFFEFLNRSSSLKRLTGRFCFHEVKLQEKFIERFLKEHTSLQSFINTGKFSKYTKDNREFVLYMRKKCPNLNLLSFPFKRNFSEKLNQIYYDEKSLNKWNKYKFKFYYNASISFFDKFGLPWFLMIELEEKKKQMWFYEGGCEDFLVSISLFGNYYVAASFYFEVNEFKIKKGTGRTFTLNKFGGRTFRGFKKKRSDKFVSLIVWMNIQKIFSSKTDFNKYNKKKDTEIRNGLKYLNEIIEKENLCETKMDLSLEKPLLNCVRFKLFNFLPCYIHIVDKGENVSGIYFGIDFRETFYIFANYTIELKDCFSLNSTKVIYHKSRSWGFGSLNLPTKFPNKIPTPQISFRIQIERIFFSKIDFVSFYEEMYQNLKKRLAEEKTITESKTIEIKAKNIRSSSIQTKTFQLCEIEWFLEYYPTSTLDPNYNKIELYNNLYKIFKFKGEAKLAVEGKEETQLKSDLYDKKNKKKFVNFPVFQKVDYLRDLKIKVTINLNGIEKKFDFSQNF